MKVYEEGKFHEDDICDPSLSIISKQNNSSQKGTTEGNLDHGYHSGSGRSSITPHSPSGLTLIFTSNFMHFIICLIYNYFGKVKNT